MMGSLRLPLVLLVLWMPLAALAADKNHDQIRGQRPGPAFAPAFELEGRAVGGGERQPPRRHCMKVCERWTQDCVVDNQGNRRCRRSCAQLGEQCF